MQPAGSWFMLPTKHEQYGDRMTLNVFIVVGEISNK